MNCLNCGAPMALLETRPCWKCGHCGTLICPEPAADGLRVTGEPGHPCPTCQRVLVRAVLDDREAIEICEHCKGTLLPRHAFAVVVTARRRAAQTPSVTPVHVSDAELRRRIACPNCAAPMTADWYYGPGNIVIDRCDACDLVWLDAGELARVVDAPGPDRRP
jgi:Zn-finger nucleic acid-binding protein